MGRQTQGRKVDMSVILVEICGSDLSCVFREKFEPNERNVHARTPAVNTGAELMPAGN